MQAHKIVLSLLLASASAFEAHSEQPRNLDEDDCDKYVHSGKQCWQGDGPNKGWPNGWDSYFWRNGQTPPGPCKTCGHGDRGDDEITNVMDCLSCEDGYELYFWEEDCAGMCLAPDLLKWMEDRNVHGPAYEIDGQTSRLTCKPWTKCTGSDGPSPSPRPAPRPRASPQPTKAPTSPSKSPTKSPTKAPTKSPTKSPTKQPAAPPGPVFPKCKDDEEWHKKRDSNKKCSWIGSNKNRCVVKGEDERWGFEACRETCGTCLEKEACPRDGDAKSNWMHESGDDFKDCAWVAEFSGNRCAQPGVDGRYAFEGCPVACRTCGYDCGVDDEKWHKEGDESKTCDWVAAATGVRCDTPGEDGVLAYKACPSACRSCATAFGGDCKDSNWHKARDTKKGCDWVSSFAEARCVVKGQDSSYGYLGCPVACDAC